jgi:hypothetical protein
MSLSAAAAAERFRSATRHGSDAMSATLPTVRILPMDSQLEFDGRSIEDVQQTFFLKELLGPERPAGKNWYREAGLKAESGTIVLFQCEGKLIASATLTEVERFKTPENGTYRGVAKVGSQVDGRDAIQDTRKWHLSRGLVFRRELDQGFRPDWSRGGGPDLAGVQGVQPCEVDA